MMSDERKGIRTGIRIPIELAVEMRWKTSAGSNKRAKAMTGNASGTGLFIRTPLSLPRDTPVLLTVSLPADLVQAPTELRCQARVVRQQTRKEENGLGVVIDNYRLRAASQDG